MARCGATSDENSPLDKGGVQGVLEPSRHP